ncbi:hypothetical protein [Mesorhizobium humile]|uniref:Uncharacterized protein n=1 Tax=Mesorhizobium humile TaxID=3072313 RepID=A0ABU4YQJ0_9HYPH|nr:MULTISPECIES: hypothetical protein [unclassified Mesorhizobium]MDX8463048.1 hypothetical protein [Mesorhizobium sp. VK2D]MDX8489251.1 hypothetical protein [Mesorhizobium sp. VK2B]
MRIETRCAKARADATLGVALPNEPFPNLNDRASIKKIIREMIIGSYLMLAGCVVAAALVVGALWWWLG